MGKRYYGICGDNGLGVYNNYDFVLKARPYLARYQIKGFATFSLAKGYAVAEYNSRQDQYSKAGTFDINCPMKLNWTYYRNTL